MKSLKSKVIASAAMLLVAAVMMTSSSFAWYTISTKGDVEKIEMDLTATTNLEIAKAQTGADDEMKDVEVALGDAGTDTKWGSKVSTFNAGAVEFPVKVSASGDFTTVEFDTDGRAKEELQTIPTASISESDLTDGQGSCSAEISGISTGADDKYVIAAVYGVWLRSNVAANVNVALSGTPVFKDGDGKEISTLDASDVQVSVQFGDAESKSAVTSTAAKIGQLTADTPKLVKIYVSIDGSKIYAKDIDKGIKVTGLGLSFTSPDVTGVKDHVTK